MFPVSTPERMSLLVRAKFSRARERLSTAYYVGGNRKPLRFSRTMNECVLTVAADSLQTYNLVVTLILTTKLLSFQPSSMDVISSTSFKEADTHRTIFIHCLSHAVQLTLHEKYIGNFDSTTYFK